LRNKQKRVAVPLSVVRQGNNIIIAFDLDGTISDPIVGVSASINYALEKLGLPTKDPAALEAYIGPPLQEIFSDLFGKENDDESILFRCCFCDHSRNRLWL
jgi:phosphoglycolate phosphatase-like HAD superfamily hydrolase